MSRVEDVRTVVKRVVEEDEVRWREVEEFLKGEEEEGAEKNLVQ